jgi:membrane protein YqaA with SNARE-associated domain
MTQSHESTLRGASHAAFDRFEQFASSRAALALMFAWACAEATVWPLIADFALVPLIAVRRNGRVLMLIAAVAGMAAGGIATFAFASLAPDAARDLLPHLPLVAEGDIEEAGDRLRDDGAWAFFVQPWSGIPYKIWGVQAGVMDMSWWRVAPAFIVARSIRMSLFALGAGAVGARWRASLRDHAIEVSGAYVVLFALGLWLVGG